MEDKYLQTRQKVYDLLKSEGYTDEELGGSAETLFADRSNVSGTETFACYNSITLREEVRV